MKTTTKQIILAALSDGQPWAMAAPTCKMNKNTYTVRPLKWEATKGEWFQLYRANVPMGSYTIERMSSDDEEGKWDGWKLRIYFSEYYDESIEEVKSLEEGKQKAFKDWQDRILPALKQITKQP